MRSEMRLKVSEVESKPVSVSEADAVMRALLHQHQQRRKSTVFLSKRRDNRSRKWPAASR